MVQDAIEGAILSVKILARHLSGDLYNCKVSRLNTPEEAKGILGEILAGSGYPPLTISLEEIAADHFAVLIVFAEGHLAVHVYTNLRYVAVDLFLCREGAEPEVLFKPIQQAFQPDKTRTTVLKRGDFGTDREIKPKTKTRMAPLRRIHNTGAKVIRILARQNKS